MSKVIPNPSAKKYVLCDKCRAIYESKLGELKIMGISTIYYPCRTCPECGYEYNTSFNIISKFVYWIIVTWRIFWHGRIDYEEKEE